MVASEAGLSLIDMPRTSILAKAFRAEVAKSKDYSMKVETEANVGYSTGFLTFDFRNGAIVNGINPNGQKVPYYSIGITDGSMVMIIGRSGCGKTTWAVQAAANIIKPFKTSCIFHDDIEAGITYDRKVILTRMGGEALKERYIHRNTGITGENFYERIKMIHDLKTQNRDAYEYDTGLYNEVGERIYKLEPTVYILDSIALLMPAKLADEDELSGQMSATATAKMNTRIFKTIIPMLKAANIILICINHITDKVDINPMQKTKSQVSYLKQNEALPGGKAIVYLTNLMIRFDDHSKLTNDEVFGIDGNLVDITLVKSRNNKAGQSVTLVFDQDTGYDAELSLFILLKEYKKINGAGAHLYLGDRSDIKFSQKKFKETLRRNPELQAVFMSECMSILNSFINDSSQAMSENEQETFDVTQMMLKNIAC